MWRGAGALRGLVPGPLGGARAVADAWARGRGSSCGISGEYAGNIFGWDGHGGGGMDWRGAG